MKIKEFSITRYGPLPNTGRTSLHNFNLFWGKNEDGKTLTIDALVKLLLGPNIRGFERIDRVEERPEGYVIIEDDKGKEIKLPEKGDLTKLVNLTTSECRNIFIIRNSDLSIARESKFYTNVTDRLTGLRAKDISTIKETLREIGKITPKGVLRDIKGEKLKTRIKKAKELIEKIEKLAKNIKKEKLDKLEEKSTQQRENIERTEKEIKSLDDARKREKYKKGKEAVNTLKKSLKDLKGLEVYNDHDKKSWEDCEKDIKAYRGDVGKSREDIRKYRENLKTIADELDEMKKGFRISDDKRKKLDEEIKPELKNYEIKSEEIAQKEGKNKFFASLWIISAILLGICLLGIIFTASLLFHIFAVLFLILIAISGVFKFQFVRDKSWLAGLFKRIKLNVSKFELGAENVEEILSNIQKFEEQHQKNSDEMQDREVKKKILEKNIERQDKTIPGKDNKIKKIKKKIEGIKRKSKVGALGEYTEKLNSKLKFEKLIEREGGILKSLFDEKSNKLEENISYWNKEIGNLEVYKDKAKNIKYSENTATGLEEEKLKLEKNMKNIDNKMSSLQKKMEEIERKVNEILQIPQLEEEYLYCSTLVDLKAVKDKLQGFITENENNKDNVLKVIKIFEKIEIKEKEEVSKLFGEKSPISKYFNKVTGELYEEVSFNQETEEIEAKRSDRKILAAEKLSGGAYDQLYLSIRLALGKMLLKGKKGFFIMDDPFVKADPDRLQRQIETLKKISELGWQVMYFSAKGEVRDALEEDLQKGTINYIKIPRIFS